MSHSESLRQQRGFIASLPEHQQDLARAIHRAVYNAAIAMSDEKIEAVVKNALISARRDLSS